LEDGIKRKKELKERLKHEEDNQAFTTRSVNNFKYEI